MSWQVATDPGDERVLWAVYEGGSGEAFGLHPDGTVATRWQLPGGLEYVDGEFVLDEDAARTWALDKLAGAKLAKKTLDKITAALEAE